MKLLKKIILGAVLSFVFVVSANAEMLKDVKVSLVNNSDVEGAINNTYLVVDVSEYYYILYSKDDNVSTTLSDSQLMDSGAYWNDSKKVIESKNYTKYASQFGDLYVTLYSYNDGYYNKVSDSILVKRPDYLPYGSRMDVHASSITNSIDVSINDIYNINSTINIKVGEINDEDILNNFALTHKYDEVLEYAKKDSKAIKNFSQSLLNMPGEYDSEGIVDDNYYYIYLSIDTENGKYYPLDEIAVCQAKNGNLESDCDFEFVKSEENQNSDDKSDVTDDTKPNDTTDNPKTGVYGTSVLLMILVSLGLVIVKKFDLFKKI